MADKKLLEQAEQCFKQAYELLTKESADAQDAEQRDKLMGEGKALRKRYDDIAEIERAATEIRAELAGSTPTGQPAVKTFKSAGQFLFSVSQYYNPRFKGMPHAALGTEFKPSDENEKEAVDWLKAGPMEGHEVKDLVENVGAQGGFLVPVEFRPELLRIAYEMNPIRDRATKIPMTRRQVMIPVLDQTGTAAGATRQHGGIVASWTEEGGQKDETEPRFRQVDLTAHKLVCYTETSDELIADEAVGLVGLLSGPMGWGGAIKWEEEYTFLRGTGVGQPLGIINANATITVARAAVGAIGVVDLFNMLSHHHGDAGMWHINRAAMPQILGLNGPAGNPSYVFINNAREGLPMSLFGMPIQWTEKLPALGGAGDICLADWGYYLIGDRQADTIMSSNHFRFRNDLTAWRAVHRVDGKPWLSQPITMADGAHTISPFVILGGPGS